MPHNVRHVKGQMTHADFLVTNNGRRGLPKQKAYQYLFQTQLPHNADELIPSFFHKPSQFFFKCLGKAR